MPRCAWNSSSAIAIRRRRASAMRPGSAKTCWARCETSRSVRTAGKDTAIWPRPASSGSMRTSGRTPDSISLSHERARSSRVSAGRQRPGVALEEGDVRAVAADLHLDREGAAPGRALQGLADERRLAVAARRDEEDLLAGVEVAAEPVELDLAVDEGRGRNDLPVDEGIGHRSPITPKTVTVT